MNQVVASKIVQIIHWVHSAGDTYKCEDGGVRHSPVTDLGVAVGDWVVTWPNHTYTTYKGATFNEHFHQVDGHIYHTDLNPTI